MADERKVSDAERRGRSLITVEIVEPYRSQTGSRWAPGERAGFPEAEARDLLKRGVARQPTKAPSGPPVDKQVSGKDAERK